MTKAIRIDPDARYIIVVNGTDDPAELAVLQHTLTEWWESDAPFCIITGFDGTTIRFERVEEGNDNGIGTRTEVEDFTQPVVATQGNVT